VQKYANLVETFGIKIFSLGRPWGDSNLARTPKMLFPYCKIDHFIST
jgi:hypothetical protein